MYSVFIGQKIRPKTVNPKAKATALKLLRGGILGHIRCIGKNIFQLYNCI